MAIFKTFSFDLDIIKKQKKSEITFKQTDYKTAKLIITIKNDGAQTDLTGYTAKVSFEKADRTKVYQDATVTNAIGGVIEVILNSQTLAFPKRVEGEVELTSTVDQSVVVTSSFYFNVEDSIIGTIESLNDIPIFTNFNNQIQAAQRDLEVVGDFLGDRIIPEVDDTNRIQRAIDSATDNGVIQLPEGTLTFQEIKLKNAVSLIGRGRTKTILDHIGAGKAIYNAETGAIGDILISSLTLDLQVNTTIGIELARVYQSLISEVNIKGNDCTGIGVSFDDGTIHASYYNTCYDVSINGYYNGVKTLGTGFKFGNSANSNRLMNCRTNYVKVGADVATDYCNHIVILGCAFEQFDTGVRLNGDLCQVVFCRFENSGGSANGIGVDITATSSGNYIIGNTVTNIATVVQNNNADGGNFIFNYSSLEVKNMKHEPAGGWTANQNMRNYGILQAGFMDLIVRTTTAGGSEGRLAYADGTTWNPGDGKGLYIHDGATHRKIGIRRPVPTTATSFGNTGDYASDTSYYYTCVAPSSWRRVALSTW